MKKKLIITVLIALAFAGVTAGLNKHYMKGDSGAKTFTAFFFSNGRELDEDNEIMELIADKIGARCIERWSNGADQDAIINDFIAEGSFPDFISGNTSLYEADALIPLDDYIDSYPNIKNYLTEREWDILRQDDGHIYWIPQFGIVKNESTEFIHDGEAFWIQTRVLKWANYPTVTTLDEYFDLLEAYTAANPYMEDGQTENIPFTILCEDWRFFCLENVPQFLDGYPNDGCCIVDPETKTVIDYNTTETARKYYKKLNEEYYKGIVDPESFTSTYDEYIAKLSTGAVLGMVDQRWDFFYGISSAYSEKNLASQGCEYVPLPITISKDVQNKYHVKRSSEFDNSTGVAITVSCQDVDGALQFINDLLDEDIMLLRYWGIKNVDYEIDEDGYLCHTEEQDARTTNASLGKDHFCNYSYFPRLEGLMDDGKNSILPEYQTTELLRGMSTSIKECFDAYGATSFVDMLGKNEKPGDWYPMYSYADTLTYSSDEGTVYNNIMAVKQRYLPMVVMSEDFDLAWETYMQAYEECNPEVFFDAAQKEVIRRCTAE